MILAIVSVNALHHFVSMTAETTTTVAIHYVTLRVHSHLSIAVVDVAVRACRRADGVNHRSLKIRVARKYCPVNGLAVSFVCC